MTCPGCQSSVTMKVIYFGLPMKLCGECNCLWGVCSWIASWFPITTPDGDEFAFFAYEGSYFKALYHWFTTNEPP